VAAIASVGDDAREVHYRLHAKGAELRHIKVAPESHVLCIEGSKIGPNLRS